MVAWLYGLLWSYTYGTGSMLGILILCMVVVRVVARMYGSMVVW